MTEDWKLITLSVCITIILAMTAQYFVFLQHMATDAEVTEALAPLTRTLERLHSDLERVEREQSHWRALEARLGEMGKTLDAVRSYLADRERER